MVASFLTVRFDTIEVVQHIYLLHNTTAFPADVVVRVRAPGNCPIDRKAVLQKMLRKRNSTSAYMSPVKATDLKTSLYTPTNKLTDRLKATNAQSTVADGLKATHAMAPRETCFDK